MKTPLALQRHALLGLWLQPARVAVLLLLLLLCSALVLTATPSAFLSSGGYECNALYVTPSRAVYCTVTAHVGPNPSPVVAMQLSLTTPGVVQTYNLTTALTAVNHYPTYSNYLTVDSAGAVYTFFFITNAGIALLKFNSAGLLLNFTGFTAQSSGTVLGLPYLTNFEVRGFVTDSTALYFSTSSPSGFLIYKLSLLDGSVISQVSTPYSNGLAYDPITGLLFLQSYTASVLRYNTSLVSQGAVSVPYLPAGFATIAVDGASRLFFFLNTISGVAVITETGQGLINASLSSTPDDELTDLAFFAVDPSGSYHGPAYNSSSNTYGVAVVTSFAIPSSSSSPSAPGPAVSSSALSASPVWSSSLSSSLVSSTAVTSSSTPVSSSKAASSSTFSSSSSTGAAAAYSDPRFVGFWGQSFFVGGRAGCVYNLLSDADMQVNAYFVQLSNVTCPLVEGRAAERCYVEAGTYFGVLSVMVRGGSYVRITGGGHDEGFHSVLLNDSRSIGVGDTWTGVAMRNAGEGQGKGEDEGDAKQRMLRGSKSRASRAADTDGVDESSINPTFTVHRPSSRSLHIVAGVYELQVDSMDEYVDVAALDVTCWDCLVQRLRPEGLLGQTWNATAAIRHSEDEVEQYRERDDHLLGCKHQHDRFCSAQHSQQQHSGRRDDGKSGGERQR